MCAIIGVGSSVNVPDRRWLAQGRDAMTHRGLDDAGEWWSADGRVGLAHRRLSIIDLSPQGHQPMHLPGRGVSLVFNGEIYNHQALKKELMGLGFTFRSNSDTEVLLTAYTAWGEDCLARLNGMFAFAIFDAPQHKLFLARDRAGEKPLFYRHAHGSLQFASELKGLLANPANPRFIDTEAMDCYLGMGFVPGNGCMLQGYNKLPPAHAMCFDLQTGEAHVWPYWQPPDLASEQGALDDESLLDELEALLQESVCDQMVADVPVGILLSGGVDSSLVTAMAVRASSQVQTFSISFPGHGKEDETQHARLIARHFGTRHTEFMAEDASADLLPRLARQFDEPIIDSSMVPTFLVSQLVRQNCTVALGGDGGDELFGGYHHYSRMLWMQQNLGRMPQFLRQGVARSAEMFLPAGFKGRNWAQGLGTDLDKDLPVISSCFDAQSRSRLLQKNAHWPLVAESVRKARTPSQANLLQRATRMDFSNFMADGILVKVDRASMLNSLEVRSPLLDQRMIEFAFGKVPSRLKATPTEKKILLKRLCSRLLPPEFDLQRKQGFSIPMNVWLKGGPFRKLFDEVLRDPQCSFDAQTVNKLMRDQDKGRFNGERLFGLVMFELWRREYGISL